MVKVSHVGEISFTNTIVPSMKHFQCFTPKVKTTGLEKEEEIVDKWLQVVKLAYHQWGVPENVHQALPPKSHIDLGLNHTKLWYEHGSVSQPSNLDYVPSFDSLFKDLIK